MTDMPETDWDTALKELMSSTEAESVQSEWEHEEAFTIAGVWLVSVDAAHGGEAAATQGYDCDDFVETCDAIAAGILLGLKGAGPLKGQDMEDVNQSLDRLKTRLAEA